MTETDPAGLKRAVVEKAMELGAAVVKSCPTDRWSEHPIQDRAYWPRSIWPWAENAIVIGIPLPAAMVSTTPSMVYQELYRTSNRILDDMAYRMTSWLISRGHRAVFFPRDGYFNIGVLLDEPTAAFSHVLAGYYSGMGTIGASHNLLTEEFGPRVRMVTILTDADHPLREVHEEVPLEGVLRGGRRVLQHGYGAVHPSPPRPEGRAPLALRHLHRRLPRGQGPRPVQGVREGHRRGQGALLQARLVTGRPPINIGDRGYGTEATR